MPRGGRREPRSPLARPMIKRITLTDEAARAIRARFIAIGQDYTATTVAEHIEAALTGPRFAFGDAGMLSWLADQRATLDIEHPAARGLDHLIAALWTEQARQLAPHNAADAAEEE